MIRVLLSAPLCLHIRLSSRFTCWPEMWIVPHDIILMGVRWYVAYPLSTRHVEELMLERGVHVDHSTINRWVIRRCLTGVDSRIKGVVQMHTG